MRVIKRFVKTCLFHLEMKENNTSYFVTCHPLSSLQSISMAYGQTVTFLFSHYEFSKTLETSILCYKLIFKSRAPITGPSKMKKRFLAFNAPISHTRTICHYSAATICSFWNAFQWCTVLDVKLEKFRSFIKLMFRSKVIQCHYCKRCYQLDCCFQLGVQIMRNFHRKRR